MLQDTYGEDTEDVRRRGDKWTKKEVGRENLEHRQIDQLRPEGRKSPKT